LVTRDVDRDMVLLRAHEPVVRLTQGEYFIPVSVERYVARAALWSGSDAGAVLEVEAGELDLGSLAARSRVHQGLGRSLSGVVTGEKTRRVRLGASERPPRLRGGGRLAAVGLLARAVDGLNRASLVFRGSVPGGSAARSFALQQRYLAPERPTYYGRVVRDGDWIICQYWFFYAFNNWRSAFGGVNEHEADWEQVTVYLDGTGEVDADGLPVPRWVVFSAHDETGDDLRRRWDDPDLTVLEGRRPVVFAGAGSHSGSYLRGDYLITIPTPTLGGLVRFLRALGRFIAPWARDERDGGVGIPYIDYARGDGRAVGSAGDPWTPVLIDDDTPWVRDFRGLWGHDTRDRLGGERGPAGPRYERDGSVRQSWADPIGWAGLAKVAPNPSVEAALLAVRSEQLVERLAGLDEEIDRRRLDLETAAAGLSPASPEVRALADEEARVLDLRMSATQLRDEHSRISDSLSEPLARPEPHEHLGHRRLPLNQVGGFRSRLLSGWAVVSTPVILLAAAAVVSPTAGVSATSIAASWLVILLGVEGIVRGRFLAVVGRVLFVVALLVGWHYLVLDWRIVLAWILTAASALLLLVNLRDSIRR
jgi:hypothetical protein